jgi:hypothetical protein
MDRPTLRQSLSFSAAAIVVIAVPAIIAVWVYLDKWLCLGIDAVRLHGYSYVQELLEKRSELPWRFVLLAVLIAIAAAAATLLLVRMVRGTRRERSIRSWMIAVGAICAWLGLVVSYDRLAQAGFQRRVTRALPKIKLDAQYLLANWPVWEQRGTGGALVVTDRPSVVYYGDFFKLSLDGPIEKLSGGGLRLSVAELHRSAWLEFRPDGSKPTSYTWNSPHFPIWFPMTMLEYRELDEDWYLVSYRREGIRP